MGALIRRIIPRGVHCSERMSDSCARARMAQGDVRALPLAGGMRRRSLPQSRNKSNQQSSKALPGTTMLHEVKRSVHMGQLIVAALRNFCHWNVPINPELSKPDGKRCQAPKSMSSSRGFAPGKRRSRNGKRIKHLAYPPRANARFQRCGFGSKNKWTPVL